MPLVELTTIDRVKANMKNWVDDDQPYTDQLIKDVSAEIEIYLDRQVNLETGKVEIFDVLFGLFLYNLEAYPVTTITSVKADTGRTFAASSAIDADNYTVKKDTGVLLIDKVVLTPGFQSLEVTYTGGIATDAEGVVKALPALSSACSKEVIARFRSRGEEMTVSSSIAGGAITRRSSILNFAPEVISILDQLKRGY